MDAAIKAGFKLLRFDAYNQDWLNFIVASRNGKQPWTGYDIIEGGVANDRVIDTIEDYLNDIITIEPVSYTHLDVYKRQGLLSELIWHHLPVGMKEDV